MRARGSGQVAQVVERSPEKAGVGGSTPSLATIKSITYVSRFVETCPNLSQFRLPEPVRCSVFGAEGLGCVRCEDAV